MTSKAKTADQGSGDALTGRSAVLRTESVSRLGLSAAAAIAKKKPNHIYRIHREGWPELFWSLLHAEWSVEDIAEGYGLTVADVRELMDEELLADHEWLVSRGEAA